MPEKKKRKSRAKKTSKTMTQRVTQTVKVNVGAAPKKAGRRQAPLRQANPPPPPFHSPHPVSASNDKITASLADVTRQLDRLQAQNRQPVIQAPIAQVGGVEQQITDDAVLAVNVARGLKANETRLKNLAEKAVKEKETAKATGDYQAGFVNDVLPEKPMMKRGLSHEQRSEVRQSDANRAMKAMMKSKKASAQPQELLDDDAGTAEGPPFVFS